MNACACVYALLLISNVQQSQNTYHILISGVVGMSFKQNYKYIFEMFYEYFQLKIYWTQCISECLLSLKIEIGFNGTFK